jgi:hypothetical protein
MNQLHTRALHDRHRASQLVHENERLREALQLIADMSEHSMSALTLQDVARIARTALVPVSLPNPALATGVEQ